MELYTLAIPIAFILLAAVLCLLLIGSKWKWWQKLALIVIVPAFGLVVWGAISSYKGWPAVEKLPTKSLVYWMLIREPNSKSGDPGAIYVWVKPLASVRARNPLEYAGPRDEPRAYKLRYSRQLHSGLQSAQSAMRDGRPIVLDLTEATGDTVPNGAPTHGADEHTSQQRSGDGPEAGISSEAGAPASSGHGTHTRPSADEPNRFTGFKIYELPPSHSPTKMPE